jgi:hypothetical protein
MVCLTVALRPLQNLCVQYDVVEVLHVTGHIPDPAAAGEDLFANRTFLLQNVHKLAVNTVIRGVLDG